MKHLFLIAVFLLSTSLFAQKYVPPTEAEFIKILKLVEEYKTIQQATPEVVEKVKDGDRVRFRIAVSKHMSISFTTKVDDDELQEFKRRLSAILSADPQITQKRKDENTWTFYVKKGEANFEFDITNQSLQSTTKFWDGFFVGIGSGAVATTIVFLIILL